MYRQTWLPYRAIYFTSYVLPHIDTLMFHKEIILDCFAKHRKVTKSLGKPEEEILNVINGGIRTRRYRRKCGQIFVKKYTTFN